jgi:hypothetical protein
MGGLQTPSLQTPNTYFYSGSSEALKMLQFPGCCLLVVLQLLLFNVNEYSMVVSLITPNERRETLASLL